MSIVLRSPGLRLRAVAGTSVPGFIASQVDSCGAGLPLGASYLRARLRAVDHEPRGDRRLYSLAFDPRALEPALELALEHLGPGAVRVACGAVELEPGATTPKEALEPFVEVHPLPEIERVLDDVHHHRLDRRAVLVP